RPAREGRRQTRQGKSRATCATGGTAKEGGTGPAARVAQRNRDESGRRPYPCSERRSRRRSSRGFKPGGRIGGGRRGLEAGRSGGVGKRPSRGPCDLRAAAGNPR